MKLTSILFNANRADWRLVQAVYGSNGGHFAKKMLASRVAEIATELRALGVTTHTPENRKRLMEICAS